MSLVTPSSFVAGTVPTATDLNTLPDAIVQIQGGSPAAGALDFAQLFQVVAQSITNATWTALTFTSEGIDSAGGHSTSSNTSRYTAVHTGWYEVSAVVSFVFNATGARGARLAVNGTAVAGRSLIPAIGVTYSTDVPLARKVYLTAGQYLELQAFQSSGGSLNTAYTAGNEGSVLEVRWVHS